MSEFAAFAERLMSTLERIADGLERPAPTVSNVSSVSGDPMAMVGAEEAAKLIGVSAETVRKMWASGELPHKKIGNRLRMSRGQLLEWQQRGVRPHGSVVQMRRQV